MVLLREEHSRLGRKGFRGINETQITKKLQELSRDSEYNRSIHVALRALVDKHIIEREKKGRCVYYRFTSRGMIIAELVLSHVKLVKPLNLSLEEALLNPGFDRLKGWIKNSQGARDRYLSRVSCEEPLRFKEDVDYYGSLLFKAFEETGIELDRKGEDSSTVEIMGALLDGETDVAFLPRSVLEELQKNEPQSLKDLVGVCVFCHTVALAIENPRSNSTLVSFPENSLYFRRILAEKIATSPSEVRADRVSGMIRGCVQGDYRKISLNAPFHALLYMQYRFHLPSARIDPAFLIVSRSAIAEGNYFIKKLILSQHRAYQKISRNKSLQYRHALNYVEGIPTRFSEFKKDIPILTEI